MKEGTGPPPDLDEIIETDKGTLPYAEDDWGNQELLNLDGISTHTTTFVTTDSDQLGQTFWNRKN